MTTTVLPQPTTVAPGAAAGPEYACDSCGRWHSGPCPAAAQRALGELLARIASENDASIPADRRRARRTLQEMLPGYERQPVLILHRPRMADDACPMCGYWRCRCDEASAPVPAGAGTRAAVR
ncbi:hypothetical protein [Streptomyces genisteinicus]|uniref:Uncharacterized protein n=1 Tax=Streptomyces genisteinicus TaxID=2768068 RepID=A0A7H0I597_9ACTN|nr:hypothetical protein [Streptomyces genisteinicus]QNP67963.1 hypothetical protein IAG43_33910 [Streptomyces genisteinicus]